MKQLCQFYQVQQLYQIKTIKLLLYTMEKIKSNKMIKLNLNWRQSSTHNPQNQSRKNINVNTFKQIQKQKRFKSELHKSLNANQKKQLSLNFFSKSKQSRIKKSMSPTEILSKSSKNTQLLNNLQQDYKKKQQNIQNSVRQSINKLKCIYVQKLPLPQLKTKLKQNYYMKRDCRQITQQSSNNSSKQKFRTNHLSQQLNLKRNIVIEEKQWRPSQNQTKDRSGIGSRISLSVIRSYSIQPKSMNIVNGRKQSVMNAYDFRHQNIRLAERLLKIRPSKGLSRNSQQKFFKKQFFYRQLRSNSCQVQNQSQITLLPNINASEGLPRINEGYIKRGLQKNSSNNQKTPKYHYKVQYHTISH